MGNELTTCPKCKRQRNVSISECPICKYKVSKVKGIERKRTEYKHRYQKQLINRLKAEGLSEQEIKMAQNG